MFQSSAGGAVGASVDAIIGQTLGSFKILSLLGEGGMGRVYLAEHVLIGRRAAIKVLSAEIADKEDIVSRFFTEARAVNDIRHPNIVEVTDFGTFGRQPFIVMELLDGETLEQRLLRVGLLDLDAAARVATQIASAVGAGHEHGMVHRDLKPANIFLRNHPDYPDFVKVLDFGIAKLVAGDRNVQHHTEIGMLIGTPAYMSPEQCLGDTHLDHHSDIYSLGVVLYQMVTGRLPFTAETAGRLIVCHVQEEPPPPQQVNPALSAAMGAVITRAMAKKPEQRFASMREMRDAVLLAAPAAFAYREPGSITPPPVTFTPPAGLPAAMPAGSAPAGTQLGSAPTTYSPSAKLSSTPASTPASSPASTPSSGSSPSPSGLAKRPPMHSVPLAGRTMPSAGFPLTGAVTPLPARPAPPSVAPSCAPGAAAPSPSTSASGSSTLADRLVEILKSRTAMDIDLDIPSMPRSILRCLDLLSAPDFSFGGMAALLASDAKLAGQLAQVANTTGPSHTPARSTEQAIARLGAEGVRTGLFEIALRPLFDSASPRLSAVCKQPWQHALAVAIISQRLMHLRGANERAMLEAYRAGLFHDAGKPITAAMLFEIERQMTNAKGRKIINEDMLTVCVDRCHAIPGARLARAWGLPPDTASAIELADQPQTSGFNLAAVIRLANALAYKGGFHTRRDELDRSRLLVDEARRAAGCDEEMCYRALDGVKDVVSRRL